MPEVARGRRLAVTQMMELTEWARLSEQDEAQRFAAMREQFERLATLDRVARGTACLELLSGELALPDEALAAMTASRFRVWLTMSPAKVQSIATSFDSAREGLDANSAMCRLVVAGRDPRVRPRRNRDARRAGPFGSDRAAAGDRFDDRGAGQQGAARSGGGERTAASGAHRQPPGRLPASRHARGRATQRQLPALGGARE